MSRVSKGPRKFNSNRTSLGKCHRAARTRNKTMLIWSLRINNEAVVQVYKAKRTARILPSVQATQPSRYNIHGEQLLVN
jgi:hypothetical protein